MNVGSSRTSISEYLSLPCLYKSVPLVLSTGNMHVARSSRSGISMRPGHSGLISFAFLPVARALEGVGSVHVAHLGALLWGVHAQGLRWCAWLETDLHHLQPIICILGLTAMQPYDVCPTACGRGHIQLAPEITMTSAYPQNKALLPLCRCHRAAASSSTSGARGGMPKTLLNLSGPKPCP